MDQAQVLANYLLEIGAVQLRPNEPFTWTSGMLSPIYCDNRLTLAYPEVRTFIKNALVSASSLFSPLDAVAGVATAGIPQGALVADALGLPFSYVRSSAKEHGRRNQIEGEVKAGQRVLVVEDLVSTGGSCIAAAEALQAAGATVAGVLAIFQYGFEKASSAFSERQLKLHTLTDYNTLIGEAVKRGLVSSNDLNTLQRWRENPDGWGALYA